MAETEKVEEKDVEKEEEWMYFTLTAYTNGPESTGKRPEIKAMLLQHQGRGLVKDIP